MNMASIESPYDDFSVNKDLSPAWKQYLKKSTFVATSAFIERNLWNDKIRSYTKGVHTFISPNLVCSCQHTIIGNHGGEAEQMQKINHHSHPLKNEITTYRCGFDYLNFTRRNVDASVSLWSRNLVGQRDNTFPNNQANIIETKPFHGGQVLYIFDDLYFFCITFSF